MQRGQSSGSFRDLSSHYSGHGDQGRLLNNIFELGGYHVYRGKSS